MQLTTKQLDKKHADKKRQAKRALTLAQALTQASAALLGVAAPVTAVQAEDHGWQVDTAALFYSEADGRVQAAEPVVNMSKDFGDERILNLKLVVDSLTGASPNGAAPASVAQTFTGPSGNATYEVKPGDAPLDDSFKDTRVAVSAGWQQPVGDNLRLNVGGNVSSEYDFQSVALNAALARDLNNKNTTLSAGINVEFDAIDPVGGAPVGLTSMVQADKGGSDSKTVTDLLFGVTQVLSRNALLQVNYSLSMASGYQSDPYKLLTVVDAGNNLITDPDPGNTAGQYLYLYEARPDSRLRHSLFTDFKYAVGENVLGLSYRFTTDDWGINTHTLDARYRFALGHEMYLEPHVRWYTQNEADFYRAYLREGSDVAISGSMVTPQLAEASADPRLAAFDATTVGLKFGIGLGRDSEFNVRIEQYQQTGKGDSAPASGHLAGQDLFPDLSATTLMLGYSFRW